MRFSLLVLTVLMCTLGCGINAAKTDGAIGGNTANVPSQNVSANTLPPSVNAKDKINQDQKEIDRTETKMVEESKTISMKATAAVSGSQLVVSYELENHSDKTIYVWDEMVGYEGGQQIIDDERAYVFFEEPATLRLVRANLALPPDIDVARKEIPFARPIQSKGKITGKIVLEVPVKEFSPFYPAPVEENSRVEKCTSVRVIIGWLEQKAGMQLSERTVGGQKVLAIRGAWDGPYHRLADAKVPVDVEAIVYKTSFDRSLPLH